MNENITTYLESYIDNPDPQYAVMLKGKWGCGKSYFVNSWLAQHKQKFNIGETPLEPIYVSLYGLSETSQITQCIDRVLHPFMYSKGVKFAKDLLNIAGKVALKTSFDANKDGKEDITLDATLDSLTLLTSRDSKIIGNKLLVFDDLERCQIDMKNLLGYINNFVEHGSCHVILVGDDSHASETAKKILIEFKEKTIGHEFLVKPDIQKAVTYFLTEDIPLSEWLQDQQDLIAEVFCATQCDNLRILRQCLYDFDRLYTEISNDLLKKANDFMMSFLASCIIVYCEYRGDYHELFSKWSYSYFNGMLADEKTKTGIQVLQNRYGEISQRLNFEVLNKEHIEKIVNYIETGNSLKNYVENILLNIQSKDTTLEELANFRDMTSETFDKNCDILIQRVNKFKSPNIYVFGRELAFLIFFDKESIFWIPQATISLAKKHIHDHLHNQLDKNTLYKEGEDFIQGLESFGEYRKSFIGLDLLDYFNKNFDTCDKKLESKFKITLSTISNENIQQLIDLSEEITPDQRCTYNMTSIFKNIDSENLFNRICGLNNKSLQLFVNFFNHHYLFFSQLSQEYEYFSEDLKVLQELETLLINECSRRKGLDRYALNKFRKYVSAAIRRANGERGIINIL